MKQRPQDLNEKIVHLTLWHRAPSQKDCLYVSYGMDFHGSQTNPPRAGDTLAATWTVHWSDDSGRCWWGQLVEIRNPSEPLRNNPWDRAAGWGKATFR